jgi:predicted PurR-regulated permease PerM
VFSALSHAVIAPLAYLGITALEGHFITPTLIGHRLTINPFLVFLSVACWSWMWDRSAGSWPCPFSCARWW